MVTMCRFNGNHQILTVSKSGKLAVKGLDDLKAFPPICSIDSPCLACRRTCHIGVG